MNSYNATEVLRKAILANSLSDVKQAIADGANVNDDADGDGRTPLLLASHSVTVPEIIKVLVEAGADIHVISCLGSTAFLQLSHNKALKDNKEIQDLLNPELHKKFEIT